ncbi:uncharacterized protein TrAtP1_011273 [Trichoderma atroviride]|uniref:uncharacterized protein n=1 Tax=Hypocrea atroviridis TaxID=63577 RepID=UPI0033297B47|nr:hypothetical protein TrAtP1_011273 [Trichoderma atroviride]
MCYSTEVRRDRRAANCGGSYICFLRIGPSEAFQSTAMMPIDSIISCHARKGLIDEDSTAQEIFSGRLTLLGKMSTRPAPNQGVSAPTMMNFSAAALA